MAAAESQTATRRRRTSLARHLTDVAFPGQSTVSRIALLALPELLASTEPDEHGRVIITEERLAVVCSDIVETYPDAWSRQAVTSLAKLVDDILQLLRSLNLATPQGNEVWLINPSAHRWNPAPDGAPQVEEEAEPPAPPGWSLFDEGDAW